MGLNALYINAAAPAERDRIREELARRLREFRDPETGDIVIADVRAVGKSASVYAPDLIVGYAPGYRASWEAALGDVSDDVIRINTDAWIGDHCIAAAAVPGVLLGNRRPRISDPQLKDLTVTILKEFGVAPDAAMNGRPVY
jgi:predicted AlkP superfamily phosphohydrolase/phosphomutase